MRRIFGRILKEKFAALMAGIDPSFEVFRGKSKYLFPSTYPYVARIGPKLWLFLSFFVDPNGRGKFTIEFGWSMEGRFPEVLPKSRENVAPTKEDFSKREFVERIGLFLGSDTWWVVEDQNEVSAYFRKHFEYPLVTEEEAEKAVDAALAEARKAIVDHVLPYLREFVRYVQKNEPK